MATTNSKVTDMIAQSCTKVNMSGSVMQMYLVFAQLHVVTSTCLSLYAEGLQVMRPESGLRFLAL